MSGSTSGIQAALPAQTQSNPLQMLTSIQSLKNAQVQNQLYQQDLQNLQLTNQTGQQNLATTMANRHAQILYGLSNRTDTQLAGGGPMYQALQDELASGQIDQQRYDMFKAQIDRVTQNGGDKDGSLYRPLINSTLLSTLGGSDAVKLVAGQQMQTTTPGGLTQTVQVPGPLAAPGTPITNVGGPVGGGLSPAEGIQPVTIYQPDGTTKQISGQQARQFQLQGLPAGYSWTPTATPASGAVQPPGAPAGAPAGAPVGAPVGAPAGAPVGAPVGAPPPAATVPPPSAALHPQVAPLGTGNIPGMGVSIPNDQQKAAAIESQKAANADMQNVSSRNWNDVQGSLQSVINMSKSVNSGPGTQFSNAMSQLLSNISPHLASALGIDASKATDTQEMAKMLARISSAGGYGSDAQMFEKIASNPSSAMNPDALRRAAGYVKGLNDQEEVLTRAANDQATHQPLDMKTWYGNTRARIQGGLDQNTFRVPYMNDAEYANYKQGLNTQAKIDAAKRTFDLMHQYSQTPMSLSPTSQPQQQ